MRVLSGTSGGGAGASTLGHGTRPGPGGGARGKRRLEGTGVAVAVAIAVGVGIAESGEQQPHAEDPPRHQQAPAVGAVRGHSVASSSSSFIIA